MKNPQPERKHAMNPKRIVSIVVVALSLAPMLLAQSASSPAVGTDDAAMQSAIKSIQAWGKDPVLVREVAAQNALKVSATQIQVIDRAWMSGGESDRVARLLGNACAQHLKALVGAQPGFSESFVTDNQGANVCMTSRTSDYWQGDEAKWQKAFNSGRGAVFVDQPKYDTSAKAILVQVSVPVLDGTIAIGTITVGVNPKLIR
jgi:hypothetical protein